MLEARGGQVTKLTHEHGGVTKAVSAPISPAPAPHNAVTLELLRSNHPSEDRNTNAACKVTIFGEAWDCPVVLQDAIKEISGRFCPEDVWTAIKKMSLHSALDPSSLRFSHFQDALSECRGREEFREVVSSTSSRLCLGLEWLVADLWL